MPRHSSSSRRSASASAVALALLLAVTACAVPAEPSPDDATATGVDETTGVDDGDGSGEGGYLDELYADSLDDGVTPAEAGTAYLETAGQRFDFASVTCSLDDTPGAQRLSVTASDETTGAGHKLYLTREIGPDYGFNFENEHVQLAYLVLGEGGAPDQFSNLMAQHARDEGEAPNWLEGSGESPLLRIVGKQVTATGAFDAVPFAPETSLGDAAPFIAAATCP